MAKEPSVKDPAAAPDADIARLSFEEALAELDKIVRQLEGGQGGLELAIDAYQRGVLLKRHCERKLSEAQAKIEQIAIGPDGAVTAEPMKLA
ncbi:exodeoxyribonuclease VII small subunit [Stella humosa]|uniref:Exodeoxyribonuclease 7 small subunit n=1 Tax=Stella humosa TaxID=94 RepID=A0A3N1L1M2_9PROT|nr:exodeoxyribonuclease VII small subunit [Stella humosa]ROP83415.1 exodeoxyribonuclease VII small subunit [Stella humosa]BBK29800.1 exodeoxyribonuclease 7 small subunit [Stella humosa]